MKRDPQRSKKAAGSASRASAGKSVRIKVSTHAGDTLRRERDLYRRLVESSDSVILLSDADLTITYMNRFGLEFFGFTEEELIGRNAVGTIIPLQDGEGRDLSVMAEELRLHPQRFSTNVHQNLRKDGSLVWMSWANRASFDEKGRLLEILAIGNDLTRMKEMEQQLRDANARTMEALHASEERYRALIETTGDFIWEMDVEGRYTYCSPQMETLWGFQPASMIGKTPFEMMPPEHAVGGAEAFSRIVRDPKPFEGMQAVSYDARGRLVWIEMGGVPFFGPNGTLKGFRGITRDITDRKSAEDLIKKSQESLREGEARLRLAEMARAERQRLYGVLETLPVYVILLDQDYRVPFANRFFVERFGESHGKRCFEYLFGYPEPCADCESYKVFETGEPRHWQWTGPDGRDYDIYDYPFTDTDGKALILEMGIDITDMKRAEAALRTLAVELGQAEQRERRRLAMILHDHIQQLLVASRMHLDAMKGVNAPEIPARIQEVVSIICEAIDASRSLAVEMSPPILQQAGLAEALEWLSTRMKEKNMFTVRVRSDKQAEPPLESARFLLFEAVRECLLNSVKYSGVQEARVEMERTGEGWTRITIADDGCGFDPTVLETHVGTGLGLFSIQQRLAYLGGRMEIDSAHGKGTRVILMAPPGRN